MNLRDAWEDQAERWAAWARTPDHDQFFWLHGLPQLLALLPEGRGRTIDVGCGEGRLPRELTGRGYEVVAVEPSPTLAGLAATHEQPTAVARGDGAALPIGDRTVDLVVSAMALQDMDDMAAAVREMARVLVPGGRLVASVVHPINSSGGFESDGPESPFVISEPYLAERRYGDEMTRGELTMTFHSMHHSVEAYLRVLEDAGLLIEAVREPPTPPELHAEQPHSARWSRVPVFLFFRAVKPA